VNRFDFVKLGFNHSMVAEEGRPPYLPADLMKLYLYGYLNRIRSSRKLEKECMRNIELLWLMKGLHPSFRTIAGFRSGHALQIKNFFREFVALLQGWDLVEGKLIAIDGSKFRAVNAKKNNFNEKKIEAQLTYIDQKINQYIQDMDAHDKDEHGDRKIDTVKIKSQIEKQQQRRKKYEALQQELKRSGQEQISTTDADARSMPINHGRIEVSYNAQTAVDAKNCLVVHYENTNTNDKKALSGIAVEVKNALHKESIEALADKGYHNGEELDLCAKNNITTYVAVPDGPRNCDIPTPQYYSDQFTYDPQKDVYICPQNQVLKGSGRWYTKGNGSKYENQVKHYKTRACKSCPVKAVCTRNKNGRLIERSQYAPAVEANSKRIRQEKEKYLLRQQIVEHPFGTIKRQWGFDHVLLKGLKKNEADFGLVFTTYNLAFLFFSIRLAAISKYGINYFFRRYSIA
ncbi:MAG: IS1182 family transposase, partial [Bacteroidetes bacterium]|nr:IS1182 family transposase [Bacteroidota bacterium]